MDKTHTQPVLLWNSYLQCSTEFRRGVIQLLSWLLHKPRNWVTAVFHFLCLHPCLCISQPRFFTLRNQEGIQCHNLTVWIRKDQSHLGAFRTTPASCLGSQLYNQVTLQSKWCSLQKSIVSWIIWPGSSFCLVNYDVSAMPCSKMLFEKAGRVCRSCRGYFNGNWNG